MKKIIVSVLFIGTACGLWAEGIYAGKWARLQKRLERAVVTQQPTWQEKLKQMQTRFQQSGTRAVATLPVCEKDIQNFDNKVYKQRLLELQEKLNRHPDLHGYRFSAPLPADLANLSHDNYEVLENFLANTQLARVTQFEWVYPFTLSLRVRGISGGSAELWVDQPTQRIYLMSDNLFSTAAAGKYGLYLK